MTLIHAVFLVASLGASASVRAVDDPSDLVVIEGPVTPTPEQLSAFTYDMFHHDPLLVFRNRADFDLLADEIDLAPDLRGAFEKRFQPYLRLSDSITVVPFFGTRMRSQRGYLFVHVDEWRRLPRAFIARYYQYRLETYDFEPETALYIRDERGQMLQPGVGLVELRRALLQYAKDPKDVDVLERSSVVVGGRYDLIANNATWDLIREERRLELIHQALAQNLGIHVGIRLSSDTLEKVAREFAGSRDPCDVARDLERFVDPNGSTVVDLRTVAGPFIREHLDTYAPTTGANCFNVGKNIAVGDPYVLEYTSEPELRVALGKGLRVVPPDEELRLEDVLVFETKPRHAKGVIIEHVAVHMTQNVVFTKNGMNRFNPYMFQTYDANVGYYFPERKYRLTAYRRTSPGERDSEASPFHTRTAYRFEHPDLRYAEIGYLATENLSARKATLNILDMTDLSHDQLENLRRLRDDPDAADVRHIVVTILGLVAKHEKNRPGFQLTKFSPLQSRVINEAFLHQVLVKSTLTRDEIEAIRYIRREYGRDYRAKLDEIAEKFDIEFAPPASRCDSFLIASPARHGSSLIF